MSYAESDLLPISALQHLLFCPRQCALIHNEQLWAENYLTAQGQVLHQKAHGPKHESRPGTFGRALHGARGLKRLELRLIVIGIGRALQ